MSADRQSGKLEPQGGTGSKPFDERCFAAGTVEHAKASSVCQRGITYLNNAQIDAAFRLIEHQIMIAGCAEAMRHLIRRAKAK